MNSYEFTHGEEYAAVPALAAHSRVDLGPIRTPLQKLQRLGDELGIELYIKRDDSQPLAMGGNKVRQLEFYLGPAAEQGADTILITGAIQSNFVRLCAAACRRLGWHPVVQLEERVPKSDPAYLGSGNVLLDKLLKAEIHYFPEGENEPAADANLDALAEEKRAEGRHPYVIHLGMEHPPYGGLGYVLGAAETLSQCRTAGIEPDHVVIPSGSGLTHAGFLVGARAQRWSVPVHGICVRRDAGAQTARISTRSDEINGLLGGTAELSADDILVDDCVLAPGYGRMNEAVHEAMERMAVQEGILLDPVYSGRCMAGLRHRVKMGLIAQGSTVIFVHTGGVPAVFGYQDDVL